MPAKDLHAQIGVIKTPIGKQGFDNRGHQLNKFIGFFAFDRIGMMFGGIKGACHPHAHRPAAFIGGLGGQQHAAHIGMHND